MLARGTEVLLQAWHDRVAVPAFTSYTLESTRAIVDAATATGRPVIIQAGSSSFRGTGRAMLAAAALAAAREADVAVGVHLDHATTLDEIRACIALGYSSVMIDGSHLSFEDNVAITSTVVAEAHASGVWVEAELGAIAGDEDLSVDTGAPAELTSPASAAEFVARTRVDALAVAVGTVHGLVAHPVHLELGLLEQLSAVVPVPLAIHGASGLDDSELLAAVALGVAKVNFNAELRRAYLGALRRAVTSGDDDVVRLQLAAVEAVAAVAAEKLVLLAPDRPSSLPAREADQGRGR